MQELEQPLVSAFGMAQGEGGAGLEGFPEKFHSVIKRKERKEKGQLVCLAGQDHATAHSFLERALWRGSDRRRLG